MSTAEPRDRESQKPRGSAEQTVSSSVPAGSGGPNAGGAASVPPPPPPPPPSPPPQAEPDLLAIAAEEVTAGAAELRTATAEFAMTTEKLEKLTKAYRKVTDALAKVDAAVRTKVTDDVYLKDVDDLLAVAALSESLREWFPVDPEMTSVRGTVLVPRTMTEKKPEAPESEKPEDKSLDVLLKELLAHLAK